MSELSQGAGDGPRRGLPDEAAPDDVEREARPTLSGRGLIRRWPGGTSARPHMKRPRKKRPVMGRPRKSRDGNIRTPRQIRFSDDEWEWIEDVAAQRGQPRSRWIRERLLGGMPTACDVCGSIVPLRHLRVVDITAPIDKREWCCPDCLDGWRGADNPM